MAMDIKNVCRCGPSGEPNEYCNKHSFARSATRGVFPWVSVDDTVKRLALDSKGRCLVVYPPALHRALCDAVTHGRSLAPSVTITMDAMSDIIGVIDRWVRGDLTLIEAAHLLRSALDQAHTETTLRNDEKAAVVSLPEDAEKLRKAAYADFQSNNPPSKIVQAHVYNLESLLATVTHERDALLAQTKADKALLKSAVSLRDASAGVLSVDPLRELKRAVLSFNQLEQYMKAEDSSKGKE